MTPNPSPLYVPVLDLDFIVYRIPEQGYHWEGVRGDYEALCSEDGFLTSQAAINDAIAFLQYVDESAP